MTPTHVTIPVNPLDMSEGAVEVDAVDAARAYCNYYIRARHEVARLTVAVQQHQLEITRLRLVASLPAHQPWYWLLEGAAVGVFVAVLWRRL